METARIIFEGIGTHWRIRIDEPIEGKRWVQLQRNIHERIDEFDQAYSRFRADSLVTRMSKKAGTYDLPPDGSKMLGLYEKLYRATEGKVTPLIGQVVADAGYDATYSFEQKPLKRPPAWEDVLTYDQRSVTLTQPTLLDFAAAGKGYLIDIVGEIIEKSGVRSYTINAGGDIRYRSAEESGLEIGLENPLDTTEAIGTIMLLKGSLCASAGSKLQWGSYHHLIDPSTLQSPREILASWVMADDTMTADGLATALFFTDAAKLTKHFSFSYAILRKDMSLTYAKDFPVNVFEAN